MISRSVRDSHSNSSMKMNLTLHVKNFGPVSDANIHIKPLTILVGPNSSGKSYMAMLTHALISSHNIVQGFRIRDRPNKSFFKLYNKLDSVLKDMKINVDGKGKINMPDSVVERVTNMYANVICEDVLTDELQYNFATPIGNLVQFGKKTFDIHVNNEKGISMRRTKNESQAEIDSNLIKLIIERVKTEQKIYPGIVTYKSNLTRRDKEQHIRMEIAYLLLYEIEKQVGQTIPRHSYYLPAARSGILHGFRTIAANMIRNVTRNAIMGVEIPPLPGTIADFMSDMIENPLRKGSFANLGKNLEKELLDGHLTLHPSETGMVEIEYQYKNHNMPLHRVSSSISELAPLVLFLGHIIRKGDLLIIEEPEAHVHPAKQLILAKYIVRMIRAGLNILITTHSVFMLEQISNFLQASKISESAKRKLNFDDDDYLTEDEISPYLFAGVSAGKYMVTPIEFSAEDGITQDEFIKIENTLTNQTWHIEHGRPRQK